MNQELHRRHGELVTEWRTRNEPLVNLLVQRETLCFSKTIVIHPKSNFVEILEDEEIKKFRDQVHQMMEMNKPAELNEIEKMMQGMETPMTASEIASLQLACA